MVDLIIIEDNPLDVHLFKRALEKTISPVNYLIHTDGEEALIYFQNQLNPLPKLILLDIKLPKIDGFELLKELRALHHTKFVPVVFLSSSQQPKDIAQAYQLGANGFLTKPSEYKALKTITEAIVSYWFNHNKTTNNE